MKSVVWTAAVLAGFLSQPTLAIVNLEDLHLGQPKDGTTGSVSFGLDGASGNSEQSRAQIGGRLEWHKAQTTRLFMANATYGESFGKEDQNKAFAHARNMFEYEKGRTWELFAQIETNKFSRLNFRGLIGTGIRWTLSEKLKDHAMFLGTGFFYSEEELAKLNNLSDSGMSSVTRGNFYLVYKKRLNDTVSLVSTTYVQPALKDVEDVRVLEDAGLQIKLAEQLNLGLSLQISHDSQPPLTVEKTDVIYNTAIEYRF